MEYQPEANKHMEQRLLPRDLYRLRRAHLLAQRAALRAQFAQHQLQEMSLELERRYGLLTREAVLDVGTGRITMPANAAKRLQTSNHDGSGDPEEVARGLANNADQGSP